MANSDRGCGDDNTLEMLRTVSTATVAMVLLKAGIRKSWLEGPKPLRALAQRVVGPAFTIRFVPGREDLSSPASYAKSNSFREAIEAAPSGSLAVIDGRSSTSTATLGDILATRLAVKGVVGVVTDAPVRDADEIRKVDLPVLCAGAAAPPSITGLAYAGYNELIGCGHVAVCPNDILVCDNDGAVVIPRHMAAEVAKTACAQEQFETYVQQRVQAGDSVIGLYPPNEQALLAYENWLAENKITQA